MSRTSHQDCAPQSVGFVVLGASALGSALSLSAAVAVVPQTDGDAPAVVLDQVISAAEDLGRTCSAVVVCAEGANTVRGLMTARMAGGAIDAVVLVDPVLPQRSSVRALFSGFAALSSVGLHLAGLGRSKATDGSAQLGGITQPVLIVTSPGAGAASRPDVARLQMELGGLVEAVPLGREIRDMAEYALSFAARTTLRSLKFRRRAGAQQMQSRPRAATAGLVSVSMGA